LLISLDRPPIACNQCRRADGFLGDRLLATSSDLAVDVALVFGLNFDLFDDQRIGKPGIDGVSRDLQRHQPA
jgi:hypothetical protein